jgi:hypothetical protein
MIFISFYPLVIILLSFVSSRKIDHEIKVHILLTTAAKSCGGRAIVFLVIKHSQCPLAVNAGKYQMAADPLPITAAGDSAADGAITNQMHAILSDHSYNLCASQQVILQSPGFQYRHRLPFS